MISIGWIYKGAVRKDTEEIYGTDYKKRDLRKKERVRISKSKKKEREQRNKSTKFFRDHKEKNRFGQVFLQIRQHA